MTFLLKPWVPFFISLMIYCSTLFLYKLELNALHFLYTIVGSLGVVILFVYLIEFNGRGLKPAYFRVSFPRASAFVIIAASIIEYAIYGIPIRGDVLYVDFGLPFVHHIVVSSWLLFFISRLESRKSLRVLFFWFALINPVMMVNRDVLLLTLFCILVTYLDEGRIRYRTFFLIMLAVLWVFGIIGQIRSPYALGHVSLPFSLDLSNASSVLLWPLIYITSSSFNMLYNFDRLRMELYSELINVFPEAYGWAVRMGYYIGFPMYYFTVASILLFFRRMALMYGEFYPLYIYLIYQSYMGVFSSKMFSTNTIFVCIVISCLFIIQKSAANIIRCDNASV